MSVREGREGGREGGLVKVALFLKHVGESEEESRRESDKREKGSAEQPYVSEHVGWMPRREGGREGGREG